MKELLSKTLSQIVTEHYQAAQVFEKHGLDFCCRGKRPLSYACEEKSIGASEILQELNEVLSIPEAVPHFENMPLSDLADYIVSVHHEYVKTNSPLILQYLQRVAAKHGDRFPYMKDVHDLFLQLHEEMEQHMMQEEQVLFPRIRQLDHELVKSHASIQAPMSAMEEEHDVAAALLQKIRALTDGFTPPEEACTTFRLSLSSLQAFEADLHHHVHLENNILFPRTIDRVKN
ncbi:MAG: iron-sulfur cluster repair di-iron protein [Flavisolibacter sp.]